jgi:hypothetical protein
MKHIKKFKKKTDYETFKNSNEFIKPNVSYCSSEKQLFYNPNDKK